ncbi:MAG: hypothetical protein D6773_03950 [Alphaproteobacteria bacterium]|nr:MAG: hypothetical protein D6773_03950 [Alphaproteobacteria bacterium]
MGRTVLAAAHRAGVGRFVFHSVLHPQTETMPHHWRKLKVSMVVKKGGIFWLFSRAFGGGLRRRPRCRPACRPPLSASNR